MGNRDAATCPPATIRSGPDPIWSKSLVLGKHTDNTAGVLESEGGKADRGDVMRRSQATGSDPAHSTSPFLRVRGSTRQKQTHNPTSVGCRPSEETLRRKILPTLNVAVGKKKKKDPEEDGNYVKSAGTLVAG